MPAASIPANKFNGGASSGLIELELAARREVELQFECNEGGLPEVFRGLLEKWVPFLGILEIGCSCEI